MRCADFDGDLYNCRLVPEVVQDAAALYDSSPALIDAGSAADALRPLESLSYRQAWTASTHVAQRVTAALQAVRAHSGQRSHGTGESVPVGVLVGRSWRLVVSLLGVLRAGGAYVPLDPDYPPNRLATYCTQTGVQLVLMDDTGAETWPDLHRELQCMGLFDASSKATIRRTATAAALPSSSDSIKVQYIYRTKRLISHLASKMVVASRLT